MKDPARTQDAEKIIWSDQLLQDPRLTVLTILGNLKHQMSRDSDPDGVFLNWSVTKKKEKLITSQPISRDLAQT